MTQGLGGWRQTHACGERRKTQKGGDPLTEAPAPASAAQLRELGIAVAGGAAGRSAPEASR